MAGDIKGAEYCPSDSCSFNSNQGILGWFYPSGIKDTANFESCIDVTKSAIADVREGDSAFFGSLDIVDAVNCTATGGVGIHIDDQNQNNTTLTTQIGKGGTIEGTLKRLLNVFNNHAQQFNVQEITPKSIQQIAGPIANGMNIDQKTVRQDEILGLTILGGKGQIGIKFRSKVQVFKLTQK